jgi:hypothetical protein
MRLMKIRLLRELLPKVTLAASQDLNSLTLWLLPAFDQYVSLMDTVMRRRGGDPTMGLKLPRMLIDAGLDIGGISVAHPSDIDGDAKLLNALTIGNIAHTIVSDGLATRDEIDELVMTLDKATHDRSIFASVTRTIQVWGRRR